MSRLPRRMSEAEFIHYNPQYASFTEEEEAEMREWEEKEARWDREIDEYEKWLAEQEKEG